MAFTKTENVNATDFASHGLTRRLQLKRKPLGSLRSTVPRRLTKCLQQP